MNYNKYKHFIYAQLIMTFRSDGSEVTRNFIKFTTNEDRNARILKLLKKTIGETLFEIKTCHRWSGKSRPAVFQRDKNHILPF